jgi:hypothetical protein
MVCRGILLFFQSTNYDEFFGKLERVEEQRVDQYKKEHPQAEQFASELRRNMSELNDYYAYARSHHLPYPLIDMVKDPLAWERQNHLMEGLELHGVTDDYCAIGASGLYFINAANEQPVWNTNTAQFWNGAWAEDTNGWRVELNLQRTNTPEVAVVVSVGRVVRNSDEGVGAYFTPPGGYFQKFELKSPDGKIVQYKPNWFLERDCPNRIPVRLYPITQLGFHEGEIWFVTNGPPCPIAFQGFRDFAITNDGDYTLTVCPVLYQNRTGKKIEITKDFHEANTNYFDRVDLPSVTTTVHLKPSP